MAIRVKHAPSAAAIGESAYTVGRGQRRERDIRLAYNVALRQRGLDLQERGQDIRAETSAEQLALRGDELDFRREDDLSRRTLAERKWNEEPSRQLQKGLQEQERLRKNIAWQYDEGQKRELAKITTGIAWLRSQVSAGKWTPEQAEQAEQQLWQKYYSIVPLPVYDDQPKPQEMYNSRIVTDPITGTRSLINSKGDFEDVPGSILFKDYSKLVTDIFKVMDARQDKAGNAIPVDPAELNERVLDAITRFSQIQGLAAKTGERQVRQKSRQEQIVAEEEQQEQQAKTQAFMEALPKLFRTVAKGQPKIGRKKKGKPSLFADDVYGEEAYNLMLTEAVGRGEKEGIAPDVIKAELDKWWDAQYDKDRGKRLQRFGNRIEFKGADREAAYGQRADGTPKGTGFFGELAVQGGGVATEYSIGVEFDGKETEIPTLVPTLTKDELNLMVKDIIPNNKDVPKAIVKKAIDHAKQRMKQGKSPFAGPGEETSAGRVKMKAPNGKTYEVDRSEAKEAEKHGWVTF